MQRSDESIKTYPLLQNPFDEVGTVRLKLSKTQETELLEALRQITALSRPVYQIAMREVSVNRRNCERSGNKATAPSPINEKAFELYDEAAALVLEAARLCNEGGFVQLGRVDGMTVDFAFARMIIMSNPAPVTSFCDEKHGDPFQRLTDFKRVANAMKTVCVAEPSRKVVGDCPLCGKAVWADEDDLVGHCVGCRNRIPTAVAASELLHRLSQADVWRSQSDTSRLLGVAGVNVSQSTIATWVRRGKLETDNKGRVCFREALERFLANAGRGC